MAKAALESVSGFNIFGIDGDHTTVMFADVDAHSRNSSILSTLLPRESASKVCLLPLSNNSIKFFFPVCSCLLLVHKYTDIE